MGPSHSALGTLVPQPGMELAPAAVGARKHNHCTSGEVPAPCVFILAPHLPVGRPCPGSPVGPGLPRKKQQGGHRRHLGTRGMLFAHHSSADPTDVHISLLDRSVCVFYCTLRSLGTTCSQEDPHEPESSEEAEDMRPPRECISPNSFPFPPPETWMLEPRTSATVPHFGCPGTSAWTATRAVPCGPHSTSCTSPARCLSPATTSASPARRRMLATSSYPCGR